MKIKKLLATLFFSLVGITLNLNSFASSHFKNVLIITDSHGVGLFGYELKQQFEKANAQVSVYSVGGSTPYEWLNAKPQLYSYWEYHTGHSEIRGTKPTAPQIDTLLEQLHPDLVVVVLGTNWIWQDFGDRQVGEAIELIGAIEAAGIRCSWVGPPDLRLKDASYLARVPLVHQALQDWVSNKGCPVFKSWEHTKYPTKGGDGVHYDSVGDEGVADSVAWADAVFEFIQ